MQVRPAIEERYTDLREVPVGTEEIGELRQSASFRVSSRR